MAFLEALAPLLEGGAEAGGAGAEAGGEAGGMGGMPKMPMSMPDFNDNPVSKLTHSFMGNIGTGGGDREKANIGPIGTIA